MIAVFLIFNRAAYPNIGNTFGFDDIPYLVTNITTG
jgi:hypothetical protein